MRASGENKFSKAYSRFTLALRFVRITNLKRSLLPTSLDNYVHKLT